MAMPPVSPRPATPEQWAHALARAHAAGLLAYTIAGDPRHWFVTSASTPGAGYLVSLHPGEAPSCRCTGAQFHDHCQHRALVLDRLGLLPLPPTAPAADSAGPPGRWVAAGVDLCDDAA